GSARTVARRRTARCMSGSGKSYLVRWSCSSILATYRNGRHEKVGVARDGNGTTSENCGNRDPHGTLPSCGDAQVQRASWRRTWSNSPLPPINSHERSRGELAMIRVVCASLLGAILGGVVLVVVAAVGVDPAITIPIP